MYNTARRWVWLPILIALAGCVQIAVWWADSAPPFAVLGLERLERVQPGHTVRISAYVLRDVKRGCAATMRRSVFDSGGYRYDIGGEIYFSAASIEAMEQRSPGRLTVAFDVPGGVLPGPAVLQSQLEYACNPLQVLWPIEVVTDLPFEVVAP